LYVCDASVFRDLTPAQPVASVLVMAEMLAHELH
jgi:hypothetical protein